jgi:hypothetical protein
MTATSAAAAASDTQRQTLPPMGMTHLTPPVKKNDISWPSSVGVRVFRVDSSSTACCGPTGHCDGGPYPAFRMWACSKSPPRQSILTRRGGGSEREVRNELLACFLGLFWRVMWDGPTGHFGGSPYPAFWMWACSETLPVYRYWRGGVEGARRGWEIGCLLVFCCLSWKIVAFHIRVGSWPVTA